MTEAQPPGAADTTATIKSSARERLAQMARAAGYDRSVLEAIADAALHPRQPGPGERATDRQLRQITAAIDVLTTAGRTPAQVLTRLGGFKDAGGEWRYEFWRAELAEANRRWNSQHPHRRAGEQDIQTIRGLAEIADLTDDQLLSVLAAADSCENGALTVDVALQQLPATGVAAVVENLRTAAAERVAGAARRAGTDMAAAYGG